MIYYGFIAFALYFVMFLFYFRTDEIKSELQLNAFEEFYTKSQKIRLLIMFSVPLISILLTVTVNEYSFIWASVVGGVTYFLYTPLIILWYNYHQKKSKDFGKI
jgi:F0F1-type ATP synthase assembly protein I